MQTQFTNLNSTKTIHDLIRRPQTPVLKPSLYVFRHHENVQKEVQKTKVALKKTLGPDCVSANNPKNYLRKHSKAPITIMPAAESERRSAGTQIDVNSLESSVDVNKRESEQCCETLEEEHLNGSEYIKSPKNRSNEFGLSKKTSRLCLNVAKPAVVPVCCSKFEIIPRGNRDFVHENAAKVANQRAKIPPPRYIDHPSGTSHELSDSGFAKKYVLRRDFGKIPQYLHERKKSMQQKLEQDQRMKEQKVKEMEEKCRHLTEDERKNLLCGLKSHWKRVFCDYQSLPLMLESPKIVQKKVDLERTLNTLEMDIQLLERHNHIFVGDAPRTFYLAN